MDVAGFVGFAAAGPLHAPVPLESPRRFRDLFGPDPELAWDEERGAVRRAHLGAAVEAFFANGGLRCWVVRVADPATAVRHTFEVPGLIDAAHTHASPSHLTTARARAAGTWCEDVAVGTALLRDPLALLADAGPDAFTVLLSPPNRYRYRLDLAVSPDALQPGDLIELTWTSGDPALLLFADSVAPVRGGVRVEGGRVDLMTGEAAGAFWIQPAGLGSPASATNDPETAPPLALAESDGLLFAAASPARLPTARRLSFELLAWRGTELQWRLGDLAFGRDHSRCWAKLPTDDSLFRILPGATAPKEPVGLERDASAPRFPLAGPDVIPAYFLPWGMGRQRTAEAALRLPASATAGSTAIDRNGLARFGAGLFVDHRLAPPLVGALLGEAQYRAYVAEQRLQGIHSLLSIEEASLIAAPDAVHRGWTRELPPEPQPLGAPELDPIPEADVAGRHTLTWSAVAGAQAYTLQRDFDPAFPAAVVAFDGEAVEAPVSLPAGCPREVAFRVRAFRDGEVGPWSNTRVRLLPRADFAACEGGRPGAFVLAFTGDTVSPGPALTWAVEDPAAPLAGAWEIEEATDPGFAAASPFAPDGAVFGFAPLAERRFAARYYRIRPLQAGVHGPWSNTVRVGPTERAAFTEVPVRAYDATVLLAVHRALLRFAAARGDLVALLGLPDHYRTAEALEHVGRLTPGGPEEEPAPAPSSPLFPRVQALTEGEAAVLSYGALYHPWTVSRSGGENDLPLRSVPPDGAAAGLMAAMALAEGAWRAPANRPLAGVVALEPGLGAGSWARLVAARVNALIHDVRGFLTKSEETLGGEGGLERVHVRRLLILLRRLALREGQRWVFEPHGRALRRRVRSLFERLLAQLFHRGAFAGASASEAFRVVVDDTVNPPSSVDRGRLVVELRVAPAAALNFLTVRLVTTVPAGLAVEEA